MKAKQQYLNSPDFVTAGSPLFEQVKRIATMPEELKQEILSANQTLDRHVNQNGITTGPKKLALLRKALALRGTPAVGTQDGRGDAAIVHVKIFDPTGSWTWYILEWDGKNEAYGIVNGWDIEYGYIDLLELSEAKGKLNIGLEVDVWFKPTTVGTLKQQGRLPWPRRKKVKAAISQNPNV